MNAGREKMLDFESVFRHIVKTVRGETRDHLRKVLEGE